MKTFRASFRRVSDIGNSGCERASREMLTNREIRKKFLIADILYLINNTKGIKSNSFYQMKKSVLQIINKKSGT